MPRPTDPEVRKPKKRTYTSMSFSLAEEHVSFLYETARNASITLGESVSMSEILRIMIEDAKRRLGGTLVEPPSQEAEPIPEL